jgi:hypothetical protein
LGAIGQQNFNPANLRMICDMKRKNSSGLQQKKRYVSSTLFQNLLQSLIFTGELNFSLQIAEKVHEELEINPGEFLHDQAAEYYQHKLNLLYAELYDKI